MSTKGLPRTVGDLPFIGRPALSALLSIEVTSLADIVSHSRAELAALHGMGPKALSLLEEALAERGARFRDS